MPAAQGMLHCTWQPDFRPCRSLLNHLQVNAANCNVLFIQSMSAAAECSEPSAAVPDFVLLAEQEHSIHAELLFWLLTGY